MEHDQRVRQLAGVAVALSSARSVEGILQALVDSLAPDLCDGCEVVLAEPDGRLVRVAAGPAQMAVRIGIPVPDEPDHPARIVFETGDTLLLHRGNPDDLKQFGPPDQPTTAAALGLQTAILAPLTAEDRVLGVLVAAHGWSGRVWQEGDREFVRSIATLTGIALEKLRLLDRQRHIARTLQASLLPAVLPPIEGAELAAHYWPAADDLQVGGDFYDVFPLGGSRWGLLVGDVCGKGVEAAAVTAAARHTARAAALHLTEPDVVLRWVHEAIRALDLAFCTIAYATFDHESGELAVSLGGHPRGIVVRADGTTDGIGRHGTLLGMIEPDLHTETTTLGPGDLLALYTDGITDVPRGAEMRVPELTALLASTATGSLEAVGTSLHATLAARRPEGFADDIALLLLRRTA